MAGRGRFDTAITVRMQRIMHVKKLHRYFNQIGVRTVIQFGAPNSRSRNVNYSSPHRR